MTDTIDALELLTQQHDEIEDLISAVADSDDVDDKLDLFHELADRLAAHATIEEKLFYPTMLTARTADLLLEATEEHLAAKRLLADMLGMEVTDEHFDAKLAVLAEQIRYHAREQEETRLFPLVRQVFGAGHLAALGEDLLAMHEDLLEGEPRNLIVQQTREAAPLELEL